MRSPCHRDIIPMPHTSNAAINCQTMHPVINGSPPSPPPRQSLPRFDEYVRPSHDGVRNP